MRIALAAVMLFLAMAGGILAPYPINAVVGQPWDTPSATALLGTDSLGRDVLSRTLHGGTMLSLTALAGGLATSVLGTALGMLAGWCGGLFDRATRAVADVLLAFPVLLAALVLALALPGPVAVVVGSVLIGAPLTARLIRESTRQIKDAAFVEVAVARGETTTAILGREILPALSGIVTADIGMRFVVALQLASALGVLGFGARPPAPDWALMLREDLPGAVLNPGAVVAPAIALTVLACGIALASAGITARERR
ncbi:ABC transporter permease [Tessaracoccus sp.]|uniref:ABC transporter permease n=1 Tax=Tessaracoccus sp. TaxID=1971211 RepID=UPI0026137301|nr:ABC transporter permease [Tessaracoccus sp.]